MHTRTHAVYVTISDIPTSSGQIHSVLTGRVSITSFDGSKYLLMLSNYDSNAILAEPIKSRSGNELLRANDKIINLLKQRGLSPNSIALMTKTPPR